jgi:hypothetical protein
MTSPEATLLRAGQVLDLKIMDDGLVHHFIINGSVDYGVLKCRGGLAARPDTVLEDLQQDDRSERLVIRTASHISEVVRVPGPNCKWRATLPFVFGNIVSCLFVIG